MKDALHPAVRDDLDCFSFPALDLSIPRGEIAPSEGFLVPAVGGDTEGGAALLKHFIGEGHAGCLAGGAPDEEEGGLTRTILHQAEFLFQPFEKGVHPILAVEAGKVFQEFWHSHSLERIGDYTLLLEETRRQIQADPEVKSLPAP